MGFISYTYQFPISIFMDSVYYGLDWFLCRTDFGVKTISVTSIKRPLVFSRRLFVEGDYEVLQEHKQIRVKLG